MSAPVRLLLISGSTRAGSTNTALLRTARIVAPDEVRTDLYDGLLRLPHFDPDADRDPLDPAVIDLRARIAAADAVLMSTPEYAGAPPAVLKNLLEWTVGGGEIYGRPVAWINASASPTGAEDAHESLAKVLGRVGADLVHHVCSRIPVTRAMVDNDGLVTDDATRRCLSEALGDLVRFVSSGGQNGTPGQCPEGAQITR